MTKEEAIEKLKTILKGRKDKRGKTETDEALEIAIKALGQEPCGDAISRQETIEAFQMFRGYEANRTNAEWVDRIETVVKKLPPVNPQEPKTGHWIPVSERLPETDNENSINKYNVLLWVKNKSHPEKEPQIYLGKLRHIDGDDGSGNFWGIETKPCEWTIWGWCYFNEPEVIAWMPLPKPYEAEGSENEK